MKAKNIFLAMIMALMSTAICPAQEGESTKEGIAAVEEIVSANDKTTTQLKSGSWTITYTNDTISDEDAGEVLDELFEEHSAFAQLMGDLAGGLTGVVGVTGGLLIAGLVLLCIFGLPILVLFLIIWLIVRASRRSSSNARQAVVQNEVDATGRDRALFNKGVRNVCLGIGLAIFLGISLGDFGVGIGALVICIGIGELLVDYFAKK